MINRLPGAGTKPFPRPADSAVLRRGRFSVLVPRRAAVAGGVLALLVLVAATISVTAGPGSMTTWEEVLALFGQGKRSALLLIQEIRLPRLIAGGLAGAALGIAGCLTQTLAANRLATPDLLGVNNGATVAILLSVTGTSAGTLGAWWAGPLGAVAAAGLIVLAAGGAGTRGYRILVVGLALSITIGGATNLVLANLALNQASAVFTWTVGSLNGRGYEVAVPVGIGLAILLPLGVLAGRTLAVLRFDEDVAASLGISLRVAKSLVLLLAVVLAGLGVGAAGPVGFVAMVAPVLAGRFAGPARVPIICSGLVGAALVVLADGIGRALSSPGEVPVGVVTSVLGGPFLLWVLLTDGSRKAG